MKPSRLTAEGKLSIELASAHPGVERIGLVLVRCPGWDGAKSSLAFSGVVLLADGAALSAVIGLTGDHWDVFVGEPPDHKPVESIAWWLRMAEYYLRKPTGETS